MGRVPSESLVYQPEPPEFEENEIYFVRFRQYTQAMHRPSVQTRYTALEKHTSPKCYSPLSALSGRCSLILRYGRGYRWQLFDQTARTNNQQWIAFSRRWISASKYDEASSCDTIDSERTAMQGSAVKVTVLTIFVACISTSWPAATGKMAPVCWPVPLLANAGWGVGRKNMLLPLLLLCPSLMLLVWARVRQGRHRNKMKREKYKNFVLLLFTL